MWWLIAIAIVGFIIYKFTKDYNESVETNVSNFGGMKTKYSILVAYLTQHPSSRVSEERKDHLSISSSSALFMIDNVGGDTEIRMRSKLPLLGMVSNKWKYPPGYPQEKMIQDIEQFLEKKMKEFENISNNLNDTF